MQREIRYVGIEIGIGGFSPIRQRMSSVTVTVTAKIRRRC